MKQNPTFYRARIQLIEDLMKSLDVNRREKVNDVVLLRNGVFPEHIESEKLIKNKLKEKTYSDEPLTFIELTKFNTWFNVYTEKVCGKEIITTSREFPIKIKGSKEDILNTIKQDTIGLLELEALALEVELQIMKI